MSIDREDLLARYEARGDEEDYRAASALYERAIEAAPTAGDLVGYGYLLYCHGRLAIRRAIVQYERAIELDAGADRAHHQLIAAYGALREPERVIALYEERLAASPADLRSHRLLARAHLVGHDHVRAHEVIDAGLALAPDDPPLIESRAELRALTGDPEGALSDYRRALELDPENLGPVYMSAFLLERQGRLQEAIEAWRYIIGWSETRGFALDQEWPRQELARLEESA